MAAGLDDAQLAELGQRWAAAINDQDAAALGALFDLEGLWLRTAKTLPEDEFDRSALLRTFRTDGARLPAVWVSQVQSLGGYARFLRVHTFRGMRGPLVRYDLGDAGSNYLLLVVEGRSGAGPRVVDVFTASTGERVSDTFGAATQLIVAPSNSLIGKLFGLRAPDPSLVALFTSLAESQRAGRIAEAYDAIRRMPDDIRNQRLMLNISLLLANQLDEDLYHEELARLARNYGDDPTTAFMLIDYHFYENDFESAMAGVESMEAAFGTDAALATLKAAIAVEAGDFPAARRYAEQGVALEPDNEDSRWMLVSVLLRAEDYAAGIAALEGLEQDFEHGFDETSFADNELFADFVRSPEYRRWIGAR